MVGVLASGCTTSMKTRPVPADVKRVDGAEYSLPALELEFAVTRRLVDCSPTFSSSDSNKPLDPTFEVLIEPKQNLVADETFSMDYSQLYKSWKTGKFVVDWHDNGMLKSVNVTTTDKSVDIALELLKTGISVARIAGGFPPVGAAPGAHLRRCPAELETRKSLLAERKKAQGELAALTATIESFSGRDAAKLSEADKKKLGKAVDDAKDRSNVINEIAKKLADLDKVLAFTETLFWRPATAPGVTTPQTDKFVFTLPSKPATLEEQARVKWVKALFGVDDIDDIGLADLGCEDDLDAKGEPVEVRCRVQQALALHVRLAPQGADANGKRLEATQTALGIKAASNPGGNSTKDHVAGVITRVPARARFLACSGGAGNCEPASPSKLADQVIRVPQLGHYLVLPFKNGIGQDNALVASFAENGLPTSVSYEDKQAAGLVVAKGLSQAADAGLTLAADIDAAQEAEKEKKEGAALKALEDQAKLLEQQKKIAEYQAVLDPANAALARQKATIDAELGILSSRKAVAQAEVDLAELEAKSAANPADYALAQEVERRQAQVLLLQAQVAIAEQCSKSPSLPACAN
ncbi:hypothetical protein [Sphingobium yanoikuyae]|uniref:hypothetical protein n=1 Tax=Sphingobium yanoikuyae TaxID=13690 RepID=UPI0013779E10|nr:hypothetical protein [Sphingobium yanoikuyae]